MGISACRKKCEMGNLPVPVTHGRFLVSLECKPEHKVIHLHGVAVGDVINASVYDPETDIVRVFPGIEDLYLLLGIHGFAVISQADDPPVIVYCCLGIWRT